MKGFVAAVFLLAGVAITAPAMAQEEVSAGHVSSVTMQVSNEVYSPFCPGKTLAMCPSPDAADVRRDIQTMAEKGLGPEEIKDKIVEQYGEEFRLVEPPMTDNLGLLGLIGGGLVLALLAVAAITRRRQDGGDVVEPSGDKDPEEADEYVADLRREYRD